MNCTSTSSASKLLIIEDMIPLDGFHRAGYRRQAVMEVALAFDLPGLVLISTGGNGHIIRRIYPEIDIVGEAVSYPQTLGKRCSAPQLEMIARLFLGGNSHILIHFNGAISMVPQLVDPL